MRTFLSLPFSKSKIKVSRKDVDSVENSFPSLAELLWSHVSSRLSGIDEADIEHYHRIRNRLYHDGTGLSVDSQYLLAYRQIAVLMLKNLFGVDLGEPRPAPTLERLILLWNQIEEQLSGVIRKSGIDPKLTFVWEDAAKLGLLDKSLAQDVTELRRARNKLVHSTSLDRNQVQHAVELGERVLGALKP